MSRHAYPVIYYEAKLLDLYKKKYQIVPSEEWHGLRTQVSILCTEHQGRREVNLQKVFNGKNSTRPCRQCYLDSLKVQVT